MNVEPGDAPDNTPPTATSHHVRELFRTVSEERSKLESERMDITRRIETCKKVLVGLAKMYGDHVPSEFRRVVDDTSVIRGKGVTDACRRVLLEAGTPLPARDVLRRIQEADPDVLKSHKPLASVVTILNRLVDYGEATTMFVDNRRTWASTGSADLSRMTERPVENGENR